MFIKVVLPAPFSPSSTRMSPSAKARSTPRQAATAPKLLEIPRIERSDGVAADAGVLTETPVDPTRFASLVRRRGVLVDVDAEIAGEDRRLLVRDHLLHFGRQFRIPAVIGRQIRAALGHERERTEVRSRIGAGLHLL